MPDILGPNSRFKYQTLGASGCSLRLEEVHYSSRQVQDAASSLACCNLENTNLLLESKRCCWKHCILNKRPGKPHGVLEMFTSTCMISCPMAQGIVFLWSKITIVRRQVPWNPSRPQCQPFLPSYFWSWNSEYLSNSLLLVDEIARFFSNSFKKHQKLDMVGWIQLFTCWRT